MTLGQTRMPAVNGAHSRPLPSRGFPALAALAMPGMVGAEIVRKRGNVNVVRCRPNLSDRAVGVVVAVAVVTRGGIRRDGAEAERSGGDYRRYPI